MLEHNFSFHSYEMIPMENYCLPSTSSIGETFSGISSMNAVASGFFPALNSSTSASDFGVLDSVPGLKHEASVAVDWSVEEQSLLEKGLEKFRDEPKIMKYIKIAATLPDKTVRDVALRCRWMQRKRRKGEERSDGKKVRNKKDNHPESSPKVNMLSDLPQQNTSYSSFTNNMCHNVQMPREALRGMAIDLLQQNAQAFSQISFNLSACELWDNINLFSRARNNINAILKDMWEMPGFMSQMPPLPVSINEDLASNILMSTTQPVTYTAPTSTHLKQEPWS